MKRRLTSLLAASLFAAACGSSSPPGRSTGRRWWTANQARYKSANSSASQLGRKIPRSDRRLGKAVDPGRKWSADRGGLLELSYRADHVWSIEEIVGSLG